MKPSPCVGAAPSIVAAPAAGTTLLSAAQIARRNPENLMQALETVPGVNPVSEGHATVPAIRGLARGRTLVLIDGARVCSERRVGPSATFADPATFEGIDVARGPGSVAYGSDALGGVISVRTRRAEPGSPLRVTGSGTYGGGIPDRRGSIEVAKGFSRGGVLVQAHAREADDWDSPIDDEAIFNSGWRGPGIHRARRPPARGGAVLRRMAERFRPRHRASAEQLADRPLLLSVRELAPPHRRRTRSPTSSDSSGWRSPASSGRSSSAPTRTGSRPPRRRAASSAPTSRPTIFTSRPAARGTSAARGSSSEST